MFVEKLYNKRKELNIIVSCLLRNLYEIENVSLVFGKDVAEINKNFAESNAVLKLDLKRTPEYRYLYNYTKTLYLSDFDLDFVLKEKDTKYTRVWSKKESADNNYMTMLYRNLMSNIFGEEYSKKSSTMLDKQM